MTSICFAAEGLGPLPFDKHYAQTPNVRRSSTPAAACSGECTQRLQDGAGSCLCNAWVNPSLSSRGSGCSWRGQNPGLPR